MLDHAYALLIGVDQNKIAGLALPAVKKDVTRLAEVLTHPQRCGYRHEHVRILSGTDATRANILDGLEWLGQQLAADADASQTAFIYYAGHGHRQAGESFLIPYDATKPLGLNAIPAKAFADAIEQITARRLLVVLDCCHAESLGVKDAPDSGLVS